MRTAAPGVKSFGLCSCAAHASSREWLAEQAGVKPERRSRCRPWSRASTTARRSSRCGSLDGTRRDAARAGAGDPAGRQVGARDLRRAALLLDALDRVLPADAAPRGALLGHGPGREDALRHQDARHGLRARARGGARGPRGDLDGARRRSGDARRPARRRRGRGHRGDRHHRVDRDQRQHHAGRERAQQRRDPEPARRRDRRGQRADQRLRRAADPHRARCPRRWRPTCATTSASSSTSSRPRSRAIARRRCTPSCSTRRRSRTSTSTRRRRCSTRCSRRTGSTCRCSSASRRREREGSLGGQRGVLGRLAQRARAAAIVVARLRRTVEGRP